MGHDFVNIFMCFVVGVMIIATAVWMVCALLDPRDKDPEQKKEDARLRKRLRDRHKK
jgi:capsular polysaccharide biosynthesis protein